jgi:galactofuranosylgalactofuranosylrhamnosyl-N-acetylglucosaminyl-diphospho-decaprenol beta-1,5/1,6-galactofuranosyltransferase
MREETFDPALAGKDPLSAREERASPATGDPFQTVLAHLSNLLEAPLGGQQPGTVGGGEEAVRLEPPGWNRPGLSDAVLQEIRFSSPRAGAEVAYEVTMGRVQGFETGLLLGRGAQVSFDAYLNSFYERYWARHAPVEDLTVRLFGSGVVMLDLFRAMPDGSHYRIGRQRVELDPDRGGAATVALEPSPAGSGRVFFKIAALAETRILAGRIETRSAPARPVRLGIGLCTFNREKMLLANLRRLVQSQYYRWAESRIVIVNQGKSFASEGMAALLAAERERIEVIEQPNLGGVGGFTRSAMEIVRGGACSHVLFMDDDIEIDPDVLVTTHAFAARTTQPTVIGGAMVDLFRPAIMYEAGAVIGSDNILRAVLHNRPLNDPKALNELAREAPCHFNGWWYCAIPAAMFREHGLPLPIFIRGDDMEYGARLTSRGVPTVSLPPVSVWHEPFYAKAPSWQLYYDLRNRLIFASCHRDLVRLDPPGVILRRLIDSLLKHDYMHAELVIRAIDDFLAGPGVLDTPMDVLHQEISALAAAHAPQKPASTVGMAQAPWRKPPQGRLRAITLLRGLADLYGGRVQGRIRPDLLYSDQWHPWMTMRVSQYAVADRMHSYVQVYRYDREKLRSALRRGLAAVQRYRREAEGAAEQWRAAHPELTSWERWERILKLAPHAADTAGERSALPLSTFASNAAE